MPVDLSKVSIMEMLNEIQTRIKHGDGDWGGTFPNSIKTAIQVFPMLSVKEELSKEVSGASETGKVRKEGGSGNKTPKEGTK